jgi:hypothetical protein
MTGLVALLRRLRREISANFAAFAVGLAGIGALLIPPASNAETMPSPERVRGFFCNAKIDSVNFLLYQAQGENEEIAVMQDGLVFKLQSYIFLPEKVERWSGSVLGSLQPSPNAKHDV